MSTLGKYPRPEILVKKRNKEKVDALRKRELLLGIQPLFKNSPSSRGEKGNLRGRTVCLILSKKNTEQNIKREGNRVTF